MGKNSNPLYKDNLFEFYAANGDILEEMKLPSWQGIKKGVTGMFHRAPKPPAPAPKLTGGGFKFANPPKPAVTPTVTPMPTVTPAGVPPTPTAPTKPVLNGPGFDFANPPKPVTPPTPTPAPTVTPMPTVTPAGVPPPKPASTPNPGNGGGGGRRRRGNRNPLNNDQVSMPWYKTTGHVVGKLAKGTVGVGAGIVGGTALAAGGAAAAGLAGVNSLANSAGAIIHGPRDRR